MNNNNGSEKAFKQFQYQYERQQNAVIVMKEYQYDYLKNWLSVVTNLCTFY